MNSLVDANVVLRVLLSDTSHPRYYECTELIQQDLTVCAEIMLEVVSNYLWFCRKVHAESIAEKCNELMVYSANPRAYTNSVTPPSGWKKEAYRRFRDKFTELSKVYPLKLYDPELVSKALDIGVQTGYDWADCILVASYSLGRGDVISVNAHIQRGKIDFPPLPEEEVILADYIDTSSGAPPRSSLSKMDLNRSKGD